MIAAPISTTSTTGSLRVASGNSLFPMTSPSGTRVALSHEYRLQRESTKPEPGSDEHHRSGTDRVGLIAGVLAVQAAPVN